MATMETKKNRNGINIKIGFVLDGQRKKLCLGSKYTVKQAGIIQGHVEEIAQAIETGGNFGKSTAGFIASMTDDLKKRFIACGLLEDKTAGTLAGLWDMLDEHAAKMGFKEHTTNNYQTARKWFFGYFSEEQEAETVTEKDAEEFRAWLEQQDNKYGDPLKSTSIAGIVKTVKTVFNLARRARLIDRSPFEFIKRGGFANPARQYEVSANVMPDILDACPSQGWRVLFALWRFGGLRKTEPLLLKWEDIFWDKGMFRIHSPKTARYAGHEERFCPLFPEIRQELTDLWELTETGAEYVLPDDIRERSDNALYNAVIRIVRRAGFTPWEKLINNLRATRDSELKRAGYSSDLRTDWLGHSETVSKKHYQIGEMLVTKEDYTRASNWHTLPTKQAILPPADNLGVNLGVTTR